MIEFICAYCGMIIEVDNLNDIIDCPSCGRQVSKELAGEIKFQKSQILLQWQLDIANQF